MADEHAFFDLQVNGYMGVDFNADALSAEQLSKACEHLRADGVDGILATIITDDVDRMAARVRNLARARAEVPLAQMLVRGIHLEGPFINETPGYVGAHPARAVRPASVAAIEPLVDAGEGLVRLVTLAPGRDAGMQTTGSSSAAFASRPAIAIPRSTSYGRLSTVGCRCLRTWETAARSCSIGTTTSFSAC